MSTKHHQAGSHPPSPGEQQHPIGVYLKIWLLLFLLSTGSYLVDFFHLQGGLRWSLVLIFMALKAGLIISIFMHLGWERLSLKCLVILPPIAILVLIVFMASEGRYTSDSRDNHFTAYPQQEYHP
ncbi:cytochrome C oxidase subunit IV [Aestuariicella hydrocarbonica]|uniref:Cytochrome C oxidase subunit IV n=1 Tax=Pseudomaricurvus hydrocarbonicus TaxID=1470433 RepID=A0A9E5T3B8_9GAMM|nr:cytochrome C oxidase subunit IV family protein [Aestuariicella hydrocarbonica]NHO67022.1 cytochrome C oxidase subunit IV [Aestuariicella hydrocarbonica]